MEPSAGTPYPEGQQGLRVQALPGGHGCLFEILDRHGRALAHVVLETPELDTLLPVLADLRAGLAEPVPATLDPSARLVALVDPAVETRLPTVAMPAGAVLALRHPGLGWLAFLLQPSRAAALGSSLLRLAQSVPALRPEPVVAPGVVPLTPPQA
jgi:hypothetical protein